MGIQIVDVRIGDVVRLRKPHPCGGYEWEVVRIGADIGIRCTTCGRRVLLPRRVFNRRFKAFVRQVPRRRFPEIDEGSHGG
ncbi:MAG: DUF951 domain-containing protein [Anaerolineae bacterium]|nr:DUF951 domain-containing protein [Anaerolineae bacterium]